MDADDLKHVCQACADRKPCTGVARQPLLTPCWSCDGESPCWRCQGTGFVAVPECINLIPQEAWDLVDGVASTHVPCGGVPQWLWPTELRRWRRVASLYRSRALRRLRDGDKLPPLPPHLRGDASSMFNRPRQLPGFTAPPTPDGITPRPVNTP